MFLTAETFNSPLGMTGAVWMVAAENELNCWWFWDTHDEDFYMGMPWDFSDSFILF